MKNANKMSFEEIKERLESKNFTVMFDEYIPIPNLTTHCNLKFNLSNDEYFRVEFFVRNLYTNVSIKPNFNFINCSPEIRELAFNNTLKKILQGEVSSTFYHCIKGVEEPLNLVNLYQGIDVVVAINKDNSGIFSKQNTL